MSEIDFRHAEVLLIRLKLQARRDRQAGLILDRARLYLTNQFARGEHPYILPAEVVAAGATTARFFAREEDSISKNLEPKR